MARYRNTSTTLALLTAVTVLAGAMFWAGCSGQQQPAANPPAAAGQHAAADGHVVNTQCPIMGGKVDPANVPDNLTRMFQGKKVGFCCAMCPTAWDKLDDDAKAAKLAAALAKGGGTHEGTHEH